MVFTLGVPSSSGAQSRVISSIPKEVVNHQVEALPYGRQALMLLGGKTKEADSKKSSGGIEFDEEKIVIPVGITPETLAKYTLYDILGLAGDIGAAADLEAIRKAYHKAVLLYHPDKAQFKTADGKEDRTVFLKIQEAMNVLSNETKRRAYDSQLPFDESIPSEERIQKQLAKGPQKFFKLFGPVFQRNARFATKKPVPSLGDMDTPLPEVYKFYQYWVHFESWRDFTGVGAEHRPDEATSREEKRWMINENEKLARKLKKKEMERLINLVTVAEKYDPRITADKEKRRLAKESEKQAKEEAVKRKAEEEAAAKAWAEQMEKEEQEKREANKVDKEKLKKAQSKARNIFRKLLRFSSDLGVGSSGNEYGFLLLNEVELLCANCSLEELTDLNNAMGGEPASKDMNLVQKDGYEAVKTKLVDIKQREEQAKEDEMIEREAKKREAEEKAAADKSNKNKKGGPAAQEGPHVDREWTRDDLSMLAKSVARYPAGSPNRWQTIMNYMNVQLKPKVSFTQDEILKAAFKLAHNPTEMKKAGVA